MYVPVALRWLIAAAFVVVIVVLSVTPGRGQSGDSVFVWLVINTPTLLQKLMHVAMYASLTFVCVWALEDVGSRFLRLALAVAFTITLGATLEWYQISVPGRFGTLLDVILNVGGTIIGIMAVMLVL